jgi:hypothetical protein
MQSYFNLPDIEDLLYDSDQPKQDPYNIFVLNKTVNGKTVSNVTKIYSWLDRDWVSIVQMFDIAKNK